MSMEVPPLSMPSHQLERAIAAAGGIRQPRKEDVVLGRGKPSQNWPGNQRMLALCDAYRDRYHSVERAQKNKIIEEVRDIISSKGGRFLGT